MSGHMVHLLFLRPAHPHSNICAASMVPAALLLLLGTSLSAAQAPSWAPAPAPAARLPTAGPGNLPLPANIDASCTPKVFNEATRWICGDSLHATHVVEPECCKRLADFYGANSTRPSRNCFCSQPYFTKFSAQTKSASITTYFQGCSAVGHTIPYYQAGQKGPCFGKTTSTTPAAKLKSRRTLRQWLHDLRYEPVLLPFFIILLVSAVGFGLIVWPWIFDLAMTARTLLLKKER